MAIITEIVATNFVASRPPEEQPTATPTTRANKVNVRYETKCMKVIQHEVVEEASPICEVVRITKTAKKCKAKVKKISQNCKKVLKCFLKKKMIVKTYPATECENIAIGEEEMCADMVKLKKIKQKAEVCSFVPKRVCKETSHMQCNTLVRKFCSYIHSQDFSKLGENSESYLHVQSP